MGILVLLARIYPFDETVSWHTGVRDKLPSVGLPGCDLPGENGGR